MQILERFLSRGWGSWVTNISPPSKAMVHDFYSNMHNFNDSESFTVFFQGQHIDVDPSILAHWLGIPRVHMPMYPYPVKTRPSPNTIANYLA